MKYGLFFEWRVACMLAAGLVLSSLAAAQSASALEIGLRALESDDIKAIETAFYTLVVDKETETGNKALGVANLLRAYPEQAERIKTALITALDRVQARNEAGVKAGEFFDEEFSELYANLIWAVGSLRDPRSVNALLGAVDTGGLATNALADLCPVAVDGLIAKSLDSNGLARRNRCLGKVSYPSGSCEDLPGSSHQSSPEDYGRVGRPGVVRP